MKSKCDTLNLVDSTRFSQKKTLVTFFVFGALLLNRDLLAAETVATVYRCPGPPVVYTDDITKVIAAARNCRAIEGEPIELAVTPKPPSVRWKNIEFGKYFQVLVDSQSVRRNYSKVSIWTNWRYIEPIESGTASPKIFYLSSKDHATYNCSERTEFISLSIRYSNSDGGDVVESLIWPDKPENYRFITPESIGESIFEYACKSK